MQFHLICPTFPCNVCTQIQVQAIDFILNHNNPKLYFHTAPKNRRGTGPAKITFAMLTIFRCFWRTYTCPILGHWYPCFGFLVTSPLGFKAKVGSALFAFAEANVLCIPLRSTFHPAPRTIGTNGVRNVRN